MKPLTKRQALTECSKMWRWMAAHPNLFKSAYFKANHYDSSDLPLNRCFACEYNEHSKEDYCGTNCIIHWSGKWCESSTAEYNLWQQAFRTNDKDKQTYYATLIADLADDALWELDKWEKNIKFGPFIIYIGVNQCLECYHKGRHSAIINISYSHEKPYYHSIFRIVKHGRSISHD